MSQRREQKICALVVWMNIAFLIWYANSNSVFVYIRVTFKIKDQDKMAKISMHSKTFLFYNCAEIFVDLVHCLGQKSM